MVIETYKDRIGRMRQRKLEQTREKIEKEGLLNEDDYGRVVPPAGFWEPKPNHPDGSFYGADAWCDNFCSLMSIHPVFIDPDDAYAGRWMYFMSKMRPNKWNPEYPYDHLKPNIEKYNINHGIGEDQHFATDLQIGLDLGWGGLLDKIEYYRKVNTSAEDMHFYDLHERIIKAILGWIERHIEYAEELTTKENNPVRKANYEEIAVMNRRLMNEPPKTLREACQWIIWFHLAERTFNRAGAGAQIDALLQPFYEKDIAEGRITDEEAVYYLACFLINDPVYWQLGGPNKSGKDCTSKISFLILQAADLIDTSLNITVRVHDGLDPELLRQSVYYLVKNKNGWPRFSGNDALVEGFMKNGYSTELARQRIAVGCNWMSLPGVEYTMNDLVKINMAKVFEVAYDEMSDKEKEPSTEKLWEYYARHLSEAVQTAGDGIRHHLKYQKYNELELVLNLLSHGPLEKARDMSDGAAEYYNLGIDGAGLAVVADSFAALEQQIELKGKTSWQAIAEVVKFDFEGEEGEKLRRLMQKSERFGAVGSLGEKWAVRAKDLFTELVRSQSQVEDNNHIFIPGLFSWANTVEFGEKVGATPNGRKAGTPISHGANPNPGFAPDSGGASLSLATSVAKIQPGYGNTAPMQWELDPTLAKTDNVELITSIIKAHCKMGGTLINVNIMDKDTLLAAHKDPSKFPELVVRVTGFTAYFAMLSPPFRQLVVDRILES